ncbi:MAG: hypothetical protein IPG95_11260 [Saprospiraceae bacterium]|nr:hypothetical protein [Saprospiraceae bacterium]
MAPLQQEQKPSFQVVNLDRTEVVNLDRTGVVNLDRSRVVSLNRTGVVNYAGFSNNLLIARFLELLFINNISTT